MSAAQWVPIIYAACGSLSLAWLAYAGEFNFESDTVLIQVAFAFAAWPIFTPISIGHALRKRASAIEARSDATPKSGAAEGESAVAESETPK